ncbi:type VII secretion protein EccB [Kutzneria kofuensis]|uniref:Type VII secretion protein EccB n=1 Tax=Kutzneria kofuensis TaxID=103725 RepID=A0A7W9KQ08_9PSEU|nr:type VII secretion protein EccB [Kutzneria kofuensis]MBB5896313.1 type VII secretion protein EccB [Kutzneria kofuensis]
MQSRRDQVQAYFFVVGRLVAGLMHGKPDVPEHPNKRFNGGTFLGVLLAGLLVACFGIFGMLFPSGNNSWRTPGTVVLEKDTGARYLYTDGQLRPALNLASALLAAGDSSKLVTVGRDSLTGVPVGAPIGIAGAPDGLPGADQLNTTPWTVCAKPADPQAVASAPTVTLRLDQTGGMPTPPDQALLVSTPDGADYLVWRGSRLHIADPTALEALGYNADPPLRVSPAWLNVLPVGRDLKAPAIADIGQPGAVVAGKTGHIGQLFELRNPATGSHELYVLQGGGLTPVSRTVAAMLLADPGTKNAYPDASVRPIEIGPGDVAGVPMLNGDALSSGLPGSPPALTDPGATSEPCLRFSPQLDAGRTATLLMLPRAAETVAMPPSGRHVEGATADQVVIPVGSGALVRSLPTPDATPGTEYLITDLGVKYPFADDSDVGALGYSSVAAVGVSPALLALLPTGPALTQAAALTSQMVGR